MADAYGPAFTTVVSDVEESDAGLLRQGHTAGLAAAPLLMLGTQALGVSDNAASVSVRCPNCPSTAPVPAAPALYSQGKPLESLVKEKLFAWLWLTSSFDAGRLHQARLRLFAHVRPAVPSTSAAAPTSTPTLTERVQMLVNETRHLAQLAAKWGSLFRRGTGGSAANERGGVAAPAAGAAGRGRGGHGGSASRAVAVDPPPPSPADSPPPSPSSVGEGHSSGVRGVDGSPARGGGGGVRGASLRGA
ncbi:hypothetical protein T492DRAFT_853425 [Pavlovales sp. CCMP2436]|nr:hypothetical protein T492DRAFT_853425 [Pavlovales sp. CCMP2436]